GEFGQRVSEVGAVFDRTEVTSGSRREAVAELVDGPQVDTGRVEREPVAVVDAGVLAEAVQEDDGSARLGGRPVPVVGAAPRVLDERHATTAARCAPNRKHSDQVGHQPSAISLAEWQVTLLMVQVSAVLPIARGGYPHEYS